MPSCTVDVLEILSIFKFSKIHFCVFPIFLSFIFTRLHSSNTFVIISSNSVISRPAVSGFMLAAIINFRKYMALIFSLKSLVAYSISGHVAVNGCRKPVLVTFSLQQLNNLFVKIFMLAISTIFYESLSFST